MRKMWHYTVLPCSKLTNGMIKLYTPENMANLTRFIEISFEIICNASPYGWCQKCDTCTSITRHDNISHSIQNCPISIVQTPFVTGNQIQYSFIDTVWLSNAVGLLLLFVWLESFWSICEWNTHTKPPIHVTRMSKTKLFHFYWFNIINIVKTKRPKKKSTETFTWNLKYPVGFVDWTRNHKIFLRIFCSSSISISWFNFIHTGKIRLHHLIFMFFFLVCYGSARTQKNALLNKI